METTLKKTKAPWKNNGHKNDEKIINEKTRIFYNLDSGK